MNEILIVRVIGVLMLLPWFLLSWARLRRKYTPDMFFLPLNILVLGTVLLPPSIAVFTGAISILAGLLFLLAAIFIIRRGGNRRQERDQAVENPTENEPPNNTLWPPESAFDDGDLKEH